mmetsp:Transcript_3097/g.6966  ORF Transcript_3097/g.6966 Transcript_3097/m.6966 type:complete len:111 (+) Transcript_3097:304-636(+)|eukprot:CAMPEP_0197488196 /NCGR_PEP_ID=MMETSP1311-20131121/3176_1 /TAXON_ID=464262 /ORGANISM="Genus nov. species nov., Strain RCC856" /LENGTH=110 /DNA_ID=CAMNT_0043032161 /DNA_START=304 /DNA_END=636 /DNA_ORIENTATION=+
MTMFQGSMYVRVKREKIAYFIQADPSDTILELKEKLQELIEKLPEDQRLLKDDTPLEDAKSLAEYRIENDDVLALTYKLPDGTFEAINIETLTSPDEDAPAEEEKEANEE